MTQAHATRAVRLDRSTPDDVVLHVRIWAAGQRGALAADLRKALAVLHGDGGGTANERAIAALERARTAGLTRLDGKRTFHEHAGAELVQPLVAVLESSGKPPTWGRLRDGVLTAVALAQPISGPAALSRFTTAAGLRAAIVNEAYGLGLPACPEAGKTLQAFAWRALADMLGDPLTAWRDGAFGSGPVLSCIAGRQVGVRQPMKPMQLLARLAAEAVGARGTDARAVRSALLRAWGDGRPPVRAASRAGASRPAVAAEPRMLDVRDDARTLEAIVAASADCEVGRFGSGKVFVRDLWRAMGARHPHAFASAGDFKARLLQLASQRRLELVRADLVEAMDADVLRDSEIRDLHATYHFVRLP